MAGKSSFDSPLLLLDDQILALGVAKEDVELYRRKHYQASFGIQTWYENLKEHTFKSQLLDFSPDEARALIAQEKSESDVKILGGLERRIDDSIKQNFPNGVFVKLDTRSPKDVPIYDFKNEKLISLLKEEIEKKPAEIRSMNHRVVSFVKATNKVMKITSGKDAISLFGRSDRVRQDITKQLDFGDKLFGLKVILREWNNELIDHPEYEFRAFVHKGQLNALTMYFCFFYSKELHENINNIVTKIRAFFESIKGKIPHTSYVIDFYYCNDGSVKIIELNPFHIGAGAGLFDWKTDRELFINGPFECRIVEAVPEEVGAEVPLQWQRWLRERYGPTIEEDRPHVDIEEDDDGMSPLLQGSLVGLVLAIIAGVALYAFRSRNPSTH